MAGYKFHILTGIILAGIVSLGLYLIGFKPSILEILLAIIVVPIYSILPDIDIESSKISHFMRIFLIAGIIYLIVKKSLLFAIILAVIMLIFELLIRHRGFFHSITASVLLTAPIYIVSKSVFLTGIAFLSYISHLLVDREIKLW